ncbi:acyl carrier protein [Marinibacterium sp. SX1]|uniref:acyl carrier protein n=1 Tax=Marinibacterium sp. SX1 TaxID=3388424 RepID=UPI003D185F81
MEDFLKNWIAANTGADAATLARDTPLLAAGMLDSLKLMEMITAIEQETGRELPLEEVVEENFETLDAILAMVSRSAA